MLTVFNTSCKGSCATQPSEIARSAVNARERDPVLELRCTMACGDGGKCSGPEVSGEREVRDGTPGMETVRSDMRRAKTHIGSLKEYKFMPSPHVWGMRRPLLGANNTIRCGCTLRGKHTPSAHFIHTSSAAEHIDYRSDYSCACGTIGGP